MKTQILLIFSLFLMQSSFAQTFVEQTGISLTGVFNSSVAWGDYNNDDFLDVLLTGNTGSGRVSKIYKNNGNGTFTEQTAISLTGVDYSSVAWGDYDNDGFLDILLTGNTGSGPVSKIYKNNGNGAFNEQVTINIPGVQNSSVAWGDYNNDGLLDILLTGHNGLDRLSKIYKNNGNNTFTEQAYYSLPVLQNSSVAWGDYNNDGFLDLLCSGLSLNNSLSFVAKNEGDQLNYFDGADIILSAVQNSSASWGDYNNDGFLDILLTGYTGSVRVSKIYKNNGNGTFSEQTGISLPGVSHSSAAWGDYNNDGLLDILLSGYQYSSSGPSITNICIVMKNNGNNSFTNHQTLYYKGVSSSSVAWGDYDNDGYLDILVTGQSGGIPSEQIAVAKVYKSVGLTSVNNSPQTPSNLQYIAATKSLIWTKASDDHTPPSSLSYNLAIGTSNNPVGNCSPHANMTNGFRRIVAIGNAQLDTFQPINNLRFDSTYYARVQAIDNGYKASAFTSNYQIQIPPNGYIINNDTTIKCGNSVQLAVSVSNGNLANLVYSWYPLSGLTNPNISNPIARPSQTTWYKVTATASSTLSFIDSVLITVNPMTVNAGNDKIITCGQGTSINPTYNYGGLLSNLTWQWSPLNGLDTSTKKNPLAKPILTTNYIVSLTSTEGCQATDTVKIMVNSITVNAGLDTVITCGNFKMLNPIDNYPGLQSKLSYQWSPSIGLDTSIKKNPIAKPLSTTNYIINLTSNEGCRATDTVKFTVIPLQINSNSLTRTCGDSTLAVYTINSNSPTINYSWIPTTGLSNPSILNPYIMPIYSTTYYLSAMDGVCVAIDTIEVTVNKLGIKPSFTAIQTLFTAPPFIVQFSNNTSNHSNYNFKWTFGDSNGVNNNNLALFHEYNFNGLYNVSLIALDKITACPDTLVREGYIYCTGGKNTKVTDLNIDNQISVFPNPASDRINLKIPTAYLGKEYMLIDNLGRVILKETLKRTEETINIQNLINGFYLLKISDEDDLIIKVIKRN
jgi:hypothetical protein